MNVFKISSRTNQGGAAVHIFKQIQEDGAVELQAIGPQATYRAIRAAAKATEIASSQGDNLFLIPEFMPVVIDGRGGLGIKLSVYRD